MGSVKRAVKKIARPKVLLPLAAIATGGAALGAFGPAAKAAMLGKAGMGGATLATGAAPGIGGAAAAASGALPTAGLIGAGGAFAPLSGSLAKGIAFGLKNPLTAKGLATYGGAGLGLASLMGKPKTEEQKALGVDPQAQYNLMRLMNEKMGGAYTDEELNILAAPQLSMYGGEYQTITGPERKRRPMFPGLNYSGLTRLAAEGGSIKPKKRKDAVEEMAKESEQREIIMDALFDSTRPGMNEDLIAERMFDAMRRQELNPMGRKDGGLMQLASAPDPMAERMDMMENLALDKFGKPLDRLSNDEVIQIEEMIDDMMPMAKGGSIPQTKGIPNGMQIDGRGGGFIPMGARERKDDVPAMLAKNEFVMTADAVRAAGGGDVNKGAQRMYDLMNSLESKV